MHARVGPDRLVSLVSGNDQFWGANCERACRLQVIDVPTRSVLVEQAVKLDIAPQSTFDGSDDAIGPWLVLPDVQRLGIGYKLAPGNVVPATYRFVLVSLP